MLILVKVNEGYVKCLKLKWIVLSCHQLKTFQKDLHSFSLLFNFNNRMCQQTPLEEIYIAYLETYQFIELLFKFKPVRLSKWQKLYLSYSVVRKYSAWKIGFKLHMFCQCNFMCSPTKNVLQQMHSCLISGRSNLLNYSSLLLSEIDLTSFCYHTPSCIFTNVLIFPLRKLLIHVMICMNSNCTLKNEQTFLGGEKLITTNL